MLVAISITQENRNQKSIQFTAQVLSEVQTLLKVRPKRNLAVTMLKLILINWQLMNYLVLVLAVTYRITLACELKVFVSLTI
ncbi:hypothetical protein EFO81_06795 [Lactiplantibacillus plantarum]|nr:hypothetical protein DA078_11615 [Lactiplantibacillus plantarum]MCT3222396.1 hypothetical protein [Lactiplantibacillus plantarum]